MGIRKIVVVLVFLYILQFSLGIAILILTTISPTNKDNINIGVAIGLILFSSLISIVGLHLANRYKDDNFIETIHNLEQLNTKLREQRHDYLNHFQVIYGLMELDEYEEAKKYIEPIFKDIMKVSKALKTAQPAINALLQVKMDSAKNKGIDMFLEIRSDLKYIPMEPWNLCKVLANIIDNSITVLGESANQKNIYIDITEKIESYKFNISNNGPRIPDSQIELIFKQGYTTKKEEGHGMGLYIVRKLVQDVGGSIEVKTSTNRTSFFIQIPKLKGMGGL